MFDCSCLLAFCVWHGAALQIIRSRNRINWPEPLGVKSTQQSPGIKAGKKWFWLRFFPNGVRVFFNCPSIILTIPTWAAFTFFLFSFNNLANLYSGYFDGIPLWSLIWSDLIFGQRGILLQQIDNVNKFCKLQNSAFQPSQGRLLYIHPVFSCRPH